MPCTAKKFEANREEFSQGGNKDVDFVLTTQELAVMIRERGIEFDKLEPGSFDMPFGFKSGAGVIFGTSGGVSEAVLRYASHMTGGGTFKEYSSLRADEGIKITEIEVGGTKLRLAVVSGLGNARKLIDKVRRGEEAFELIEVMACCGGCINGGGQPVSEDHHTVQLRAKGLYDNDKMLQIHSSQENPYIQKFYNEDLDEHTAHALLHTEYKNRKRISGEEIVLSNQEQNAKLKLNICFGTSCFIRGAQDLYTKLMEYVKERGIADETEFKVSFCSEQCEKGPNLSVNDETIHHCTIEKAIEAIEKII